jgi:putative holliday junction resolvase
VKRVLGVDSGHKRVGLAISDPLGLTARPLEVVGRADAVAHATRVCQEMDVDQIVVGMPRSLGGGESDSMASARELGAELAAATGIEVVFVDERYTSKMAEGSLLESGMKRRDRRERVDKVAAAIILQSFLDGNPGLAADVEPVGGE